MLITVVFVSTRYHQSRRFEGRLKFEVFIHLVGAHFDARFSQEIVTLKGVRYHPTILYSKGHPSEIL